MSTPNLSSRIGQKHQHSKSRFKESIQASPEVLPGEAYQLDRLADRLYDQASFWLIVGDVGDMVCIAGQAHETSSTRKHPGVVEIIRNSDGSIQISAVMVNQQTRQAEKQLPTAVLARAENPAQLDVVEVAWLASITDPQQGARQIGSAAFQEVRQGGMLSLFDD